MKRFFSTIFWFIILLVVLGILGVIFFPQTAVQFFGEKQQDAIKTSLWCDMPTLETEFDYNNKIDELNTKLDMLIKKSETEVVIDIDSVNEENNENEENDNDDEEEKPTTGDTTTS